MKQKSIGINAILNGGKTVLNMLFPLITFPYVSRVLQSENLGKYNFSQSIITYFIMIAGLEYPNMQSVKVQNIEIIERNMKILLVKYSQ